MTQAVEMEGGMFVMDRDGNSYASLFMVEKVLYSARSEYQKIMVFETKDLGRVLMLDDIFNVSPVMEAFYHEPMAHIPMAMADGSKEVLIIGGGDFGVAYHVVKHDSLQRLTLCELDAEILKVSRRFFPQWAACEQDPRVTVAVGDGFAHLSQCRPESLDVIIVDSTDPYLHDSILISDEFFNRAALALKPGGVMMQIVADFIFYRDVWLKVIPRVKRYFSDVAPMAVPIPFYATGAWGLMLAGKETDGLDPERVSADYLSEIQDLRTLTPELVAGWFSLPPFIRKSFATVL